MGRTALSESLFDLNSIRTPVFLNNPTFSFVFWWNCFRIRFLGELFSHSFLQFVPRGDSFVLIPFPPPVQQTTDRIGNRIFDFLGGLS